MLRIDIQSFSNSALLHCSGNLVFGVETETLRSMVQARHEEHLRVDLSRIGKIDASGLGVLVELQIWARENRRQLSFVELSEDVWRVVILTKLYAAVDISYSGMPAVDRESFAFEPRELIA